MHPNGNAPYQKMPPPPLISRGQPIRPEPQTRPPLTRQMPATGQVRKQAPQHSIRAAYKPKPLPPPSNEAGPSRGRLIPTVNPVNAGGHKDGTSLLDKQTGRIMMLASLAFLIFYVLLVSSKLMTDHNNNKRLSYSEQQAQAQSAANQISNVIEDNIAWMSHGINDGKNAQSAAKMIANSPKISSVAILAPNNKVIAQFPTGSNFLSQVSLKGIGNNGYEVSSIIEPSGNITPIIITKSGNYFTAVALTKNALLNLDNNQTGLFKTALIAPSGRIIDGEAGLGKIGPRDWFNLSAKEFSKITQANFSAIDSLNIHGTKFRLISQPIPNSQLKLLQAKPTIAAKIFKGNISLFAILFLGTCMLVALLLNSLNRQLKSTRNIQRETEISQQRYQAAIEGDSGGIWELDIPENTAYLSASLSGLLGMPRLERNMPMSQFLNMFHPNEREKFLIRCTARTYSRRV